MSSGQLDPGSGGTGGTFPDGDDPIGDGPPGRLNPGGGGDGNSALDALLELIRRLEGRLDDLTKSLTVSVLGIQLLENPEGFVVAALMKWLIDTSLATANLLAVNVRGVLVLAATVTADGLGAALGPAGGAVGSIVLTALAILDDLIGGAVGSAGPLAPFVALLLWGATAVLILVAFRYLAGFLFRFTIGRVIPL